MNVPRARGLLALTLLALRPLSADGADSGIPVSPAAWNPDLGDGRYQNPVLFADYSDPDAIRVGEDYWLTASSFSHVPGLPILHSRDLVNWTIVGHALPRLIPLDHFSVPRHGGGVWAPAIRFHRGKFWIFYPDPDFGIYAVTATDPRAAWSEPVLVKAGKGLIDPCPFWDDDGKAFLIHGWAKSRSGQNNLITLHELSADGSRVVDGDGHVIIDENKAGRGLHTLEGPKLYKRGGTYWIFAPVNGVQTGEQAVYRATDIRGPYEVRIVLGRGSSPINGPHQGAWVDTPAGENWFLHFQDRDTFGRVVHLQPMAWGDDGWPRMGTAVATGAEAGEPVIAHRKPRVASGDGAPTSFSTPATSDEFDRPQLGLQWQWQANPEPGFFSLTAQPGSLRLDCVAGPAATSLYDSPNLLLQKFSAPGFTATTALDLSGGAAGSEAGLMIFGYSYAWVGLRRDARGLRVVQVTNVDASKNGAEREVESRPALSARIFLRVSVASDGTCRFAASDGGRDFAPFGVEFKATQGRWVGAKVGLFAAGAPSVNSAPAKPGQPDAASAGSGHADFDFFHLTP